VSVVEYNLLSDKPVSTRRLARTDSFADTKHEVYKGDVFRRTSARDICVLTRQLATLLHAGMPLVPALSALVEQMQGDSLSQIMKEIRDSVNAGSSFAGALGKHPGVFSNLFVNMVAAGETSGTLEEVLLRLAEILDKRAHLAGKVKSVIAYPLMLTVVAVGVVMFLLSFVVPSITQIFLEINRQLPWPTRLLISTSAFMKTYLLVIIAAVCVVVFGIGAWVRTEEGRIVWDRSKLKMPLFGKLFLKLEIARLTRTLGILLASGIPVLSALEITKGVVQNRFIAGALGSVKDLVGKGDNIADAVRNTGLFPPIVFHIIATGQISGDIEGGLLSIADMYDGEVEMMAKTLTSLLEPAIVLAMGAVVGFIVLAILLPIFEINQVL
jgi:general secretion pathway protein F